MMVKLDNERIKALRSVMGIYPAKKQVLREMIDANAEKIRARGGDWQLVADTLELINAKGSM